MKIQHIFFVMLIFILFISGCYRYEILPDSPGVFGPISESYPYNCTNETFNRIYYDNITNEAMICNGENWSSMSSTESKKIGTYAYLNKSAITHCVLADTWYPINGIFINNPVSGFYVNTSIPALVYNYSENLTSEIIEHTSLSSDRAGTTISMGVAINGVVNEKKSNNIYMKNINQIYHNSGNNVVNLYNGDEIQLVIKSSLPNTYINVTTYTTSIKRFW